jgi:hypothetical protein
VFGLHVVVIRLNDGFFARKIIIGCAKSHPGSSCDLPHRGGFQTTLAENPDGVVENIGSRFGALTSGDLFIEHVQILQHSLFLVKSYFEHVQSMR